MTFLLTVVLTVIIASAQAQSQNSDNQQADSQNASDTQDTGNKLHQQSDATVDKKPYSFLKPERQQSDASEVSSDALTVSLGLIFILILIFSLAWFLRKIGYSHISGQGQLKILATMNLGQKEKIALIQVGTQQLLIGITSNQINTLHVLDEPLDSTDTQESEANGFAKKLTDSLANLNVKN